MNHSQLVTMLRDIAGDVSDSLNFFYGRESDFNAIRSKGYPYCLVSPSSSRPSFTDGTYNYSQTWNLSMFFLDIDTMDSVEDQYLTILNKTDLLCDKYIDKLNRWINDYGPQVTISDMQKEPVIKYSSDCYTGTLLTFTILTPDTFDYCANE